MAVLDELFLQLAGLDTGLRPADFVDAGEQEVHAAAARLGAAFERARAAPCAAPALRAAIDEHVVLPYLRALADTECATLSRLGARQRTTGTLLEATGAALAAFYAMDAPWTRLLAYANDLLDAATSLPGGDPRHVYELLAAHPPQPGDAGAKRLVAHARALSDAQWRDSISDGLSGVLVDVDHPCLDADSRQVLANVARLCREFAEESDRDLCVLEPFVGFVEQAGAEVAALPLPLTSASLHAAVEALRGLMHTLVRTEVLANSCSVRALKYLDCVLFFSDSLYADFFAIEMDGARALQRFDDAANCALAGPSVLDCSAWPLRLWLRPRQVAAYHEISQYLEKIVCARLRIGPAPGAERYAFGLVLTALWQEFQVAVRSHLQTVRATLEQNPRLDAVDFVAQAEALQTELLMRSHLRARLEALLQSDLSDVDTLRVFCAALAMEPRYAHLRITV